MKRRPAIESHRVSVPVLSSDAEEDDLLDSIHRMLHRSEGSVKTILVVDSDLGFVYWLGCTLCAAGYLALPAKNCQNASELLNRLNIGIRLLVVNCTMPGASAFAEELRRSQEHLKVIALTGDGEEPGLAFPAADASQSKHSYPGDVSEIEWLKTIEAVFAGEADCRAAFQ